MGKKSREKRERRQLIKNSDQSSLLSELFGVNVFSGDEKKFQQQLASMRALFRQYNLLDLALALGASELWPANTGSPIKHIFAWCVLLDSEVEVQNRSAIITYQEFKAFVEALYAIWPEFPMLEDFYPENDWGQIYIRFEQSFAPVFYGSCIERTPDFIEAFRITYAHIPKAIAHMDLVIAMQSLIIESIPALKISKADKTQKAHVEVAPEDFWLTCRPLLQQIGSNLAEWRNKVGGELDVHIGAFKAPLTWSFFGDAVMQGTALPFLAVENGNAWVPMSVRNAPGVIIDYWANQNDSWVSPQTHKKLAQFVTERFQNTVMGPLTLLVSGLIYEDLPVSCIISANSGVYLICACDHESLERLSTAAKNVYTKVHQGAIISFRLTNGRIFTLSSNGIGPCAEELKILIVVTLANTALSSLTLPAIPTRLLPLADFITIFDSLNSLDELEIFWQFVDSQNRSFSPFSRGAADLFASFKDTHGVLIEGAISPTIIGLNPHWGTSWRFKELTDFWSQAPKIFPDGSSGWRLSPETKGVVALQSRHHKAVAYSTYVGASTVQTMMEISKDLRIEDARLVDLFAQLLADCSSRCSELMFDILLFQQPHVLFTCISDPYSHAEAEETSLPLSQFTDVVTAVKADANHPYQFNLQVDTRAVLAGLNGASDGSFEVRCLLETLEKCHATCGLKLPKDFVQRLSHKTTEPARYHLRISARYVDVPDYVDPIIPSPTDYKLARKQLAAEIMALGLAPGRYELSDAKSRIDPVSARLRSHIEQRIASLEKHQLLRALIEQHDAVLVSERLIIQRARQSLAHAVEYDRLEAVEGARKEFGTAARHYRYLLEKTVSSMSTGLGEVTEDILRELVSLVDWYMVLTGASDTLHNGLDVGGVEIDDFYVPDVFYSKGSDDREETFAREYAKSRLGLGAIKEDAVGGESESLLSSEKLKNAFMADLGFDLQNMLTALAVLSQAQRHGFGNELALSFAASPNQIIKKLVESIQDITLSEAEKIVAFLTLSDTGVLRLSGRDSDEPEIPYWEHSKRIHRYTIRPLVLIDTELRWGAETASRAMYLWSSAVQDGYLPADFEWPRVKPIIRDIKESIENKLELRTEEIFRRHTPFVLRGIDFKKRFRNEGFADVGDFDVFAYWPEKRWLVTVECKYNQPFYTLKDGRRLRDRIFGKTETDRAGQFSRIHRRRQFLEENCLKMLELLGWPQPELTSPNKIELYVSRDIYYWMVHPPYPVPTEFVTVDTLDNWIRTKLRAS